MLTQFPTIYGLDDQPLVDYQGQKMEHATAEQFIAMQAAATKDGFALAICSSYRSLDRQLAIWNAKACGERRLLDCNSQPLDASTLNDQQLVDAILIWSALPGTSRHHWGTDIDIFDANQITKRDLQLVSHEYQAGGPCYSLSKWLARYSEDFGFYLPFQAGKSGVSPEPWHLSYFPVANRCLSQFDSNTLNAILATKPMQLKEAVLPRLEKLVAEYVFRVAPSPSN